MRQNLQWSIAYCGHNSLGLITTPNMKRVTYGDGNTKHTWTGVHLTDKKYTPGSRWTSRHPVVIAQLGERAGRDLLESITRNSA